MSQSRVWQADWKVFSSVGRSARTSLWDWRSVMRKFCAESVRTRVVRRRICTPEGTEKGRGEGMGEVCGC